MLNFRSTNITFIVLVLILIGVNLFYKVPFPVYLLLAVIYLLILFLGSYFIQSQFFMPAICKGDTLDKQIAITFDDGPATQFTPDILELLSNHNVKATFFCIGKNAGPNHELLKKIDEHGHLIGSHSFSHGFWFDLLSSKKMERDLIQAHDVIKEVIGKQVKWFRPPYGVTNPNLKKAVEKMGYTAIGWNVRSMDTVSKSESALLNELKANLKPGNIFLFHDTAAVTVKVLPDFFTYARQNGYAIVPLDKLINLHAYAG